MSDLAEAQALVERYIDWALAENLGEDGNLRIVLGNYNLEDHHLDWNRGWCDAKDDRLGAALCGILQRLPLRDRYRAVSPSITDEAIDRYEQDDWLKR